jgi:hypothetical protein
MSKRDRIRLSRSSIAFLKAIGGTERLAAVERYDGRAVQCGLRWRRGGGKVEIFAKAPDSAGMWFTFPEVHDRGDAVLTLQNGKTVGCGRR